MKQLPLQIGPAPAPSLENFVVGSNLAALQALREMSVSAAHGPLYLWGAVGVGKSHLLRASLSAARAGGHGALAVDAHAHLPWAWDERARLVAIDDCDSLDADRQHAAFALFVEAAIAGVPVLAAGRVPPVDLPIREDLRTRLGSGLVFLIHPPSEDAARAALQQEAARRGIGLGDELLRYLLTHFERDLGSLMGLLDALDAFGLARKRALTVPLLKQMLSEAGA